jgi:lipopolysaccharide/colanic/teichoic acid biosynthesis glycosyltransferase
VNIRGDTTLRRSVDVVVSLLLLAVLVPVLLAVAVAVRLDSPGPVLYRAVRVGRGGGQFRMLKFRSMTENADRMGAAVSGSNDPRVTRVGRLLRASKLDEVPQLFNVVGGTMTLVGPRAESPRYVAHYTAAELALLRVRPGMTGPGQLEFTRRQAAELDAVDDPDTYYVEHQLHDKLAADLAYLAARGPRRDVAVVADTVGLLLRSLATALVRRIVRRRTTPATGYAGKAGS